MAACMVRAVTLPSRAASHGRLHPPACAVSAQIGRTSVTVVPHGRLNGASSSRFASSAARGCIPTSAKLSGRPESAATSDVPGDAEQPPRRRRGRKPKVAQVLEPRPDPNVDASPASATSDGAIPSPAKRRGRKPKADSHLPAPADKEVTSAGTQRQARRKKTGSEDSDNESGSDTESSASRPKSRGRPRGKGDPTHPVAQVAGQERPRPETKRWSELPAPSQEWSYNLGAHRYPNGTEKSALKAEPASEVPDRAYGDPFARNGKGPVEAFGSDNLFGSLSGGAGLEGASFGLEKETAQEAIWPAITDPEPRNDAALDDPVIQAFIDGKMDEQTFAAKLHEKREEILLSHEKHAAELSQEQEPLYLDSEYPWWSLDSPATADDLEQLDTEADNLTPRSKQELAHQGFPSAHLGSSASVTGQVGDWQPGQALYVDSEYQWWSPGSSSLQGGTADSQRSQGELASMPTDWRQSSQGAVPSANQEWSSGQRTGNWQEASRDLAPSTPQPWAQELQPEQARGYEANQGNSEPGYSQWSSQGIEGGVALAQGYGLGAKQVPEAVPEWEPTSRYSTPAQGTSAWMPSGSVEADTDYSESYYPQRSGAPAASPGVEEYFGSQGQAESYYDAQNTFSDASLPAQQRTPPYAAAAAGTRDSWYAVESSNRAPHTMGGAESSESFPPWEEEVSAMGQYSAVAPPETSAHSEQWGGNEGAGPYSPVAGSYGSLEAGYAASDAFQDDFIVAANTEIRRISKLLDARELELNALKQELQETKAQLSIMKTRAEAELSLAQHALIEKDSQLRTAEAAMAGLEQVSLEYWGAGHSIKLGGSFNGWQHHVDLQPDLTSEIPGPSGARGPMMWEATLWLYPGQYEIKFIVDGEWTVDPRREVAHGSFGLQNNVLRVEKRGLEGL